jgi:hypothetical protein
MLLAYTGHAGLSSLLAAVAMLSMPASAFNYQYYPEAAAGLLLALLVSYATLSQGVRADAALFHGLLTGFLPWVHLRFGPALIVILLAVGWSRRRTPHTVAWFAAGMLVPLGALGLYNYHIAGSMMPWALYDVLENGSGSFDRMWSDLPHFLLDWRGGLLANAPVYLLAFLGLLTFWRQPQVAAPVTAITLATAALSASYTWHGSGTTPLRLIAAVMPLLVLPMADAVRRYRHSRVFVVAVALLAAVSIQNGLTYNRHMIKHDSAQLAGPSVSGWKSPLLLVDMDHPLGIVPKLWVGALVILVLLPRNRRSQAVTSQRSPSWVTATAFALIGMASVSSTVAALNKQPFYYRYFPDDEVSRNQVVRAYLAAPSGLAFSSLGGGFIDIPDRFPNPGHPSLLLEHEVFVLTSGDPVDIRIHVRGEEHRPGWGMLTIDYGDGTPTSRAPLVGTGLFRHRYVAPGTHTLAFTLTAPGGPVLHETRPVHITPNAAMESEEDQRRIPVPPAISAQSPAFAVSSLAFSESGVVMRSNLPRSLRQSDAFSVWMAFPQEQGAPSPRLHPAERLDTGAPETLTLRFTPQPRVPDGQLVGLIVIARTDGRSVRSELLSIRWPAERLLRGGPLLLTSAEAGR